MNNHLDEELLALASRLAVQAGTMAREGRRKGVTAAATKSTATDMVTEFDKASEELIVGGLRAARPDDGIVGEEGTDQPGTTGIDWLVDPIDGTTNFLYGLPGWAVSIAARDATGARVGAVYVPATDELFTARAGHGAHLNGEQIQPTTTTELGLALVATGFSYSARRRADQAARVAQLLPQVRDIRRGGAAATDLCHVAAGRVDAYFEQWLGPWDLAAGALIAREAGCTVSALDGSEIRPDSVLVAAPGVHGAMRDLITQIDDDLAKRA
ncbi:MAG TPA: inositol monophosphatase family protein [Ilumatobacteraceae bacterium]|nr:inositol monophosphatase family protein [Ilumatobacteraceae bacterium]